MKLHVCFKENEPSSGKQPVIFQDWPEDVSCLKIYLYDDYWLPQSFQESAPQIITGLL